MTLKWAFLEVPGIPKLTDKMAIFGSQIGGWALIRMWAFNRIFTVYLFSQMTWGQSLHMRQKRSAAHGDAHAYHESHTVLEELTHIFHIGSMAILSVLVAEVQCQTFSTRHIR